MNKIHKKSEKHLRSAEKREPMQKGEDAMSAVAQNYVYSVGKKIKGKQEAVMSEAQLKAAKVAADKFLPKKK